ncbi:MAG: hydroxyacid dehydrogenase [Candidatus Altiarchaeota archaeon]
MEKPRVLVTDKYHEKAIGELRTFADVDEKKLTPEELVKEIGGYDAILVRSATKVTKEVIEAGNLKIIGRAGVGLDNVDREAAKAKGVTVVNTPEASSVSVAEMAIALMLSYARNIAKADKSMKDGLWEKKQLKGFELSGKTLGLIGFGRIGKEVAARANAFGMKVIVYDPAFNQAQEDVHGVKGVSLEELLKESDIVSLHVPAVEGTIRMINADRLSLMKKNALLVNTARGKVVDEEALVKALKEGVIAGAALDVYEKEPLEASPLTGLPNVVLTPHIGAGTDECQLKGGMMVVEKFREFFSK